MSVRRFLCALVLMGVLAPRVAAAVEMRGVWITRFTYRTAADVIALLDDARAAGCNAVFFQARGRFDALYESELEPWASELTGTLGQDPGWDPLAVAIREGHARGLEVHAWMNLYAFAGHGDSRRSVGVPHRFVTNPEWEVRTRDGGGTPPGTSYRFAAPGNPEVRAHVVAVVADVAARYAVDGIHLDYVRYPSADTSYDAASRAAWGGVGDYDAWQRAQIVETVLEMQARVDVPISAAVWGITENPWGWANVGPGLTGYHQDTAALARTGALDAIVPMIYWPVTDPPGQRLDFATLAAAHVAQARGRPVWTGIDIGRLSAEEIGVAIAAARVAGAEGVVLFEASALRGRRLIEPLATGPFAVPP